MEKETKKTERGQKRLELIKQVSMVKKWGRGVIATIAANLGRTVGAVRQMLSVLTKEGLLVRIRRGQYSVA
jgi:predicted transcriptional regulator of viral defense system